MNSGGTVTECTNNGAVSGGSYVGGICGKNSNTYNSNSVLYSAEISSCKNTGNVKGEGDNTGGICGYNHMSSVQGCRNTGNVKGEGDNTGGICGYNLNGSVQGCHNTGDVTGTGKYVGGVCGYNPYNKYAADGNNNTIQKCDNSGTVTGKWDYTGGVCGRNDNSRTLQECYNTGAVSGTGDYTGGVCGWNSGTVQECYTTREVSGTNNVGGVCGQNSSSGTVKGCYNTGTVTGHNYFGAVCGVANGYPINCYYLDTSAKTAGGGTPKTAVEFHYGAVAYLLQSNLGEGADPVWGQTIGTNESPVLAWQKDYKKVYPTAEVSPCKGYSNTENDSRDHKYENGECIYCGEKQPVQIAYTVTIPATVELGGTPVEKTISATGVVLPDGKQLNVKVADDSKFKVTLDGTGEDEQAYTVTNGESTVNPGDTVLSVADSVESESTNLTFSAPQSTTYSGTYTGTVTFTVSVDEKSAS